MVIKGQSDIEVFVSDDGYICLKQRPDYDGDQLIVVAPAYASKIAGAIAALQGQAQQRFEKAPPEER